MELKTMNDLFNVFIYGVYVVMIYGITLFAASYFGIGAGLIIILGLGMIVFAVFNWKYLELFRRKRK